MILFAQAAPTASDWGGFMNIMGWVFGAIMAGCAIAAFFWPDRKREITPQPLRVEFEREFTPRRDFEQHVAEDRREHENLFKKIGGVERGAMARLDEKFSEMLARDEEGRAKLHGRINEILGEVRELKGEVRAQRHLAVRPPEN